MSLEMTAVWWLRHEKKCVIVLNERSPREWACGRPDTLGITKNRYATEIEIKRTLSDFRADSGKARTKRREFYAEKFPKQFYYLVPEPLAEKCLAELPDWAGLMTSRNGHYRPEMLKVSPVNTSSKRYSVRECCVLSHLMANQIVSQAVEISGLINSFKSGHEPWLPDGVPDYQI